MMFGLSDNTISTIKAILKQFSNVEQAIIYGSRAKGNYRPGSDIDLTLIGSGLDFRTISRIAGAFDDSLLPYFFDVSDFDSLRNEGLRDHIRRVGKVLYEKQPIPQ